MTTAFAELLLFTGVKPDPPRREDGRCALDTCTRGPKKAKVKRGMIPKPSARHKRYGGDALLTEPFCSRPCCETWHGVTHKKLAYEFADETGQNRKGYLREWHDAGNKV